MYRRTSSLAILVVALTTSCGPSPGADDSTTTTGGDTTGGDSTGGDGDSDTTTPLMVCTSPACNLVWLQGYGGERPEPRSSACPRCRQTGNWSSQAGGYECRQLFNCAQGNCPY